MFGHQVRNFNKMSCSKGGLERRSSVALIPLLLASNIMACFIEVQLILRGQHQCQIFTGHIDAVLIVVVSIMVPTIPDVQHVCRPPCQNK